MGDAQPVAAFGTAALQDIAAIGCGHPGAEPMSLHFMPDFRLVRAFHRAFPLLVLFKLVSVVKCAEL